MSRSPRTAPAATRSPASRPPAPRATAGPPESNSGATSPITVSSLTNTKTYTCTVHATNAIGDGSESVSSSTFVAATIPDAPTISGVTRGQNSAIVAITANSTGGSTITGYSVTCDLERRRHDPVELWRNLAGHRFLARQRQHLHLHRHRHQRTRRQRGVRPVELVRGRDGARCADAHDLRARLRRGRRRLHGERRRWRHDHRLHGHLHVE